MDISILSNTKIKISPYKKFSTWILVVQHPISYTFQEVLYVIFCIDDDLDL